MPIIQIFSVQQKPGTNVPIHILNDEFNTNNFKPIQCSTYVNPRYLFCIKGGFDVASICEKYGYNYYPSYRLSFHKDEIDVMYRALKSSFGSLSPHELYRNEGALFNKFLKSPV
jgi:hypothetical protein